MRSIFITLLILCSLTGVVALAEDFQLPTDLPSCQSKVYDMQIKIFKLQDESSNIASALSALESQLDLKPLANSDLQARFDKISDAVTSYDAKQKQIVDHAFNIYNALENVGKKQQADVDGGCRHGNAS